VSNTGNAFSPKTIASVYSRNPATSARPKFLELTTQLSSPDSELLKWSEEDESVNPEAAQLGADLQCAINLHMDLQHRYNTVT
jgi:hypothetical protein